jgi:hypothetical protein
VLLFPGHKRVVPLRHLFSHAGVAQHLGQVTHGEQVSNLCPLVDSFRRICLRVKHGSDRKASHSFVLPTSGRTYVVSPGNRALLDSYPLGRNWVAVIFIDLAPKLGLEQNVRIELRGPLHLLPALLDSYEAFAHSLNGLDRYQEVVVVEAQVPPDGDVQEAPSSRPRR